MLLSNCTTKGKYPIGILENPKKMSFSSDADAVKTSDYLLDCQLGHLELTLTLSVM